eukprot:622799_1
MQYELIIMTKLIKIIQQIHCDGVCGIINKNKTKNNAEKTLAWYKTKTLELTPHTNELIHRHSQLRIIMKIHDYPNVHFFLCLFLIRLFLPYPEYDPRFHPLFLPLFHPLPEYDPRFPEYDPRFHPPPPRPPLRASYPSTDEDLEELS